MNDFDNLGRLYVLCGGTKEDFCMEGHRLVKMIHKLSEDIDEGYFLAWLLAHADSVTIMGDGDLMILDDVSKYEVTERVAKHTVSPNGTKCIICTGNIIDFNDDYIEVNKLQHDDVYKQLLDGFEDVLNELQVAIMKEGYSNETELHNDKGAADCKCKGTAEKARTTCKRNRGCRTCGKGRKD